MIIQRQAAMPLRPFIKFLWASDEAKIDAPTHRERLLPTGSMHVVFRLSDQPIRIFGSVEDRRGHVFGCAVVAGLRSRYYVKDVPQSAPSVGAVLQPGAAQFLFGVPADELAEQHTSLDALWGSRSADMHELLREQNSLQEQLDLFESFLTRQVPVASSIHQAVAYALKRLPMMDIAHVVRETGYSHKQFIKLFRTTVGLPPKLYCRILRFQRVLKMISEQQFSPVDIALQLEYSDQAHYNRDFREFAGISPGEYQNLCPTATHHVPLQPRG
jgi:AraC-like DNA-binding protein